jgi:hypothetical protein
MLMNQTQMLWSSLESATYTLKTCYPLIYLSTHGTSLTQIL